MVLCAVLILFFLCGCVRKSEIPSYVRIEGMRLVADSSREGSSSSSIVDCWVYYQKEGTREVVLAGSFEMPAEFPLPGEGLFRLIIKGGIKNNGMVKDRVIYPFYTSIDTVVNLRGLGTTNLGVLTVRYASGVVFHLIEDFEGSSTYFVPVQYNTASLVITHNGDSVFEGSGSARITFSGGASDTIFLYQTSKAFSVNAPVPYYLEMNYWAGIPFVVGIIDERTQSALPVIQIKESEGWKKIYIELSGVVSRLGQSQSFRVYIGAKRSESSNFVLMDNIKLISGG